MIPDASSLVSSLVFATVFALLILCMAITVVLIATGINQVLRIHDLRAMLTAPQELSAAELANQGYDDRREQYRIHQTQMAMPTNPWHYS